MPEPCTRVRVPHPSMTSMLHALLGKPLRSCITFLMKLCILSSKPGPNIPLNLPIIQIIILHLSTPLFKTKVPII